MLLGLCDARACDLTWPRRTQLRAGDLLELENPGPGQPPPEPHAYGHEPMAAATNLAVRGDLRIAPGGCLDAYSTGTVEVGRNVLVGERDPGARLPRGWTSLLCAVRLHHYGRHDRQPARF